VGEDLEEVSPFSGCFLAQFPHGPLNASDLVVTMPDVQIYFARTTNVPTDGANLLMEIPTIDVETVPSKRFQVTYKNDKNSGTPPTPKLDRCIRERERERERVRVRVSRKTYYLGLAIYRPL
jgi:hypothetical protein